MSNQITESIYPICYRVEKEIVGQADDSVAKRWGHASSIRHAHSIQAIEEYAARTGKKSLSILNAGGLACGHQDFAICSYLKDRHDITWTVFESPASPYLANKTLKTMIDELPMELVLSDFTDEKNLYGDGKYDVILFTEIAEHLEHGTLLTALRAIRERLKPDGMLIFTTPNLASMGNRISLLFGNGDLAYWGDGHKNLEEKLWGHIVYYDIRRAKRLLADSGLKTREESTFWYMQGDASIIGRIIYALSFLLPHAKQTMFLVAERGDEVSIPMQI